MQNRRLFRFITFVSTCLLLLGTSQPALTAPNQTTRASVASDGEQANKDSLHSIISADGRFVAFQSMATNLVAGDTNDSQDIFVHDRQTGETTRVSVDSDGVQGNGTSVVPSISADGRFVAFQSYATNLVADDTNGVQDIFVHDRKTGETTRVSVDSDGVQGNDWSNTPAISGDGHLIAFRSTATNLVANDNNGKADIFVHNLESGETTRVSINANDVDSNGNSADPVISEDGRYVAFSSYATNLGLENINFGSNIFVHDRQTKQITHVSVDSDGLQGNGNSYEPTISADGCYVAFESDATNLVAEDTNNVSDIFIHDCQTGKIARVSIDSDGVQGDGFSFGAAISGEGRFVAFSSASTNLVAEDTNEESDVFVHNRLTGETLRASVSSDGAQGNGRSTSSSISRSGHYVVFNSRATNLVAGDTNNIVGIFVRGAPFPEVTFEQAPGQPDLTVDSPIIFTATFTKPIDTATFDGSDVLLGGTAGATAAVVTQIAPYDGTTFNIAVSGMTGYGTVIASIPFGVVEDSEGYYLNAASTSVDNEVTYTNTILHFALFFR